MRTIHFVETLCVIEAFGLCRCVALCLDVERFAMASANIGNARLLLCVLPGPLSPWTGRCYSIGNAVRHCCVQDNLCVETSLTFQFSSTFHPMSFGKLQLSKKRSLR